MTFEKFIIISISFFLFNFNAYGSVGATHPNELNYRNIGEFIYVHTDRDIYVAGENIFFKIYLLNSLKKIEIDNSKVAYIVIRNGNQKRIIESRLWLDNKTGFGSISIPDTLSTGFYQIVAFTNWMKEEFEQDRFTKEIYIVNRFDDNISGVTNEDLSNKTNIFDSEDYGKDSSGRLNISLPRTIYTQRSKVSLDVLFQTADLNDSIADVSISVMDLNSLLNDNVNNIEEVCRFYKSEKEDRRRFINYKSIETNGLIVSGRVLDSIGVRISNQKVFLSTPDTVVNLQYVITDLDGTFQFMLNNYYEGKTLFLGLLNNNNAKNYRLLIDDKYVCSIPYNPSGNSRGGVPAHYLKRLQDVATVNKSFEVDFTVNASSNFNYFYCPQLYSVPEYKVYTSDYLLLNRLDIMLQEMFYGIKINKKDQNSVSIADPLTNQVYDNSFVFLDGVPFFNINDIIGYGSDRIKRIEAIHSAWVLDDFLFKGILSIFTYNSEINNFKNAINHVVIPAGEYLPRKKFLSPDYSVNVQENRMPDFRQVLYWNPQVRLDRNNAKEITFFTGDLCSDYLIKVEGISTSGIPLSSSFLIKVVNN